MVDDSENFTDELRKLIFEPHKIKNTNKFASLLTELNYGGLINPLLEKISMADKTDIWLSDFLYAVSNLLAESSSDITYKCPKNLISKLEDWLINHTGELAWKAAILLKFYESDAAAKIQLKKLEERGDFFLTYVECIRGLLHYDYDKHIELVKQIANDETRDERLREYCREEINTHLSGTSTGKPN